MKKILIWVAVIVIAIFVLSIAKDQIIKSVVTMVATEVTGAPVHMDGFSLGVFSQSVKILGLKYIILEDFPEMFLLICLRLSWRAISALY